MAIDWAVVAEIAKPVAGGALTLLAKHLLERKPRVITYYGSVSTHQVSPPNQPPFRVFTHEVVVRNVGKRPATDVRLMHAVLPDHHVTPPVPYTIDNTPGGSQDIVIPTLVPGEQVVVSYLYWPPLIAGNVNTGVKHDEGFAQFVPVLLQRQFPPMVNRLVGLLMLCGAMALAYLAYLGVAWLYGRIG